MRPVSTLAIQSACSLVLAMGLSAQTVPPIQVGTQLMPTLDLRGAEPSRFVPLDPRVGAQVEATRRAWETLLTPFKGVAGLRLLLPEQGSRLPALLASVLSPSGGCPACRIPMLLAASRAIKAADPACRLYLAYQPGQEAILDENAWGALDGGVLLPQDLGADPKTWEGVLAQAQAQFPGRPWFLWMDRDPGALAGVLLGDGGRLVVADGGPTASLARELPAGPLDLEGGLGDLVLTPRDGRPVHWRFLEGGWQRVPLTKEGVEVAVAAQAPYNVGALLARIRARRFRRMKDHRTCQEVVTVAWHSQEATGAGEDWAEVYDAFSVVGEGTVWVLRELLIHGVRANLDPGFRFPDFFEKASKAFPLALGATERFHYADGGPVGADRRLLKFKSLEGDSTLYEGTLEVLEASAQILRGTFHRAGSLGMLRSETYTMELETGPGAGPTFDGFRRVVALGGGTAQYQYHQTSQECQYNREDFYARRDAAMRSGRQVWQPTLEGWRTIETKPGHAQHD